MAGILAAELEAAESKQDSNAETVSRTYTVETEPVPYNDRESYGTRRDDKTGTLYVFKVARSSVSGKVTERNVAPAVTFAKAASLLV